MGFCSLLPDNVFIAMSIQLLLRAKHENWNRHYDNYNTWVAPIFIHLGLTTLLYLCVSSIDIWYIIKTVWMRNMFLLGFTISIFIGCETHIVYISAKLHLICETWDVTKKMFTKSRVLQEGYHYVYG